MIWVALIAFGLVNLSAIALCWSASRADRALRESRRGWRARRVPRATPGSADFAMPPDSSKSSV